MSCVLFVIKTILHGEIADGECSIEGYNLLCCDRETHGGRIAVYILHLGLQARHKIVHGWRQFTRRALTGAFSILSIEQSSYYEASYYIGTVALAVRSSISLLLLAVQQKLPK